MWARSRVVVDAAQDQQSLPRAELRFVREHMYAVQTRARATDTVRVMPQFSTTDALAQPLEHERTLKRQINGKFEDPFHTCKDVIF